MSTKTETKPETKPAFTEPNGAMVAQPRAVRVVEDDSELASLLDTARFEHMHRIAEAMALGSFIPEHIRSKDHRVTVGNCFRVVNQAIRWGMDPWSVIDETYVVKGKLGYQGKLVAAVINARAGIPGGLKAVYNAKAGDDFAIVVYTSVFPLGADGLASLQAYADSEDRRALGELTALGILAVRLSVGQGRTDNQMWKKDPEQKLFYSAATKWARRHRPEIILGVLTEPDLEALADQAARETPAAVLESQSLAARLADKAAALTPREVGDEPASEEEMLRADAGVGR